MSKTRSKTQARLTPPLKWHGGKHYLARRIIKLMPPHLHYGEPFFGGGAVLLAKDPNGISEVVNDIYGELINFWRVRIIREMFPKARRRLEATPFYKTNGGSPASSNAFLRRSNKPSHSSFVPARAARG